MRAAIADLIAEGLTQTEIAERLGVRQPAVSRHYRAALEYIPLKTVDQRRDVALFMLDEMLEKGLEIMRADHPYVSEGRIVYPVIGRDADNKPIYGETALQDAKAPLQAITALNATLKRMMEQIGGDAPKRLETVNTHVSAQDLRVSALLGDLGAGNTVRAEAIRERVTARAALPPGAPPPAPRPVGAAVRRLTGAGADPRRIAARKKEGQRAGRGSAPAL